MINQSYVHYIYHTYYESVFRSLSHTTRYTMCTSPCI